MKEFVMKEFQPLVSHVFLSVTVIFPALHRLWISLYYLMGKLQFNPVLWLEDRIRTIIQERKANKRVSSPYTGLHVRFLFFSKEASHSLSLRRFF